MEKLQFATGNTLKFEETRAQLARSAKHITLEQLNVEIPELQSNDPLEILRGKVAHVQELTDEQFFVDDTSFDTERFPGFPGSYAKFTNQTLGREGMERLFEHGDGVRAIARIALFHEEKMRVFEAELRGTFQFDERVASSSNHLFDELICVESGETLGDALKNPGFMNHRRRATEKLGQWLCEQK